MNETFPTKQDLREVYPEYANRPDLMEMWTDWLHNSWHNESMAICPYSRVPVRYVIFGNTKIRLENKFGTAQIMHP